MKAQFYYNKSMLCYQYKGWSYIIMEKCTVENAMQDMFFIGSSAL